MESAIGVEKLANLTNAFGLGTVLALIIATAFIWVIKYVMNENSKREERALKVSIEREERLAEIINTNLATIHKNLLEHDARAIQAIRMMEQNSILYREEQRLASAANAKIMESLAALLMMTGFVNKKLKNEPDSQ